MKTRLFLILFLIISHNIFGADLVLTNLQFEEHYVLITNWSNYTNYLTAHIGYSEDTSKPLSRAIDLCYNYELKGEVISNNILDIFDLKNGKLNQSVIIDSNKILDIEITEEKKILYKTNYHYLENPKITLMNKYNYIGIKLDYLF